MHSQYVQFMRDYLQLGDMLELSPEDIDKKHSFYLPHHPVITQKLRVDIRGHEWTVLKRSSAHWTQHSTKPFLDLYAFQNV